MSNLYVGLGTLPQKRIAKGIGLFSAATKLQFY